MSSGSDSDSTYNHILQCIMNHLKGSNVDNEKTQSLDPFMLQKMNYHISQLPFAAKCPDAPLLPPSKTLPDLVKVTIL